MGAERTGKTPVIFYRTLSGTDVVRNWLRGLNEGDRNAIGQDVIRVQYRQPVGMPLCCPMGDGLWEVRSNLPSGRIAPVLFSNLRFRYAIDGDYPPWRPLRAFCDGKKV